MRTTPLLLLVAGCAVAPADGGGPEESSDEVWSPVVSVQSPNERDNRDRREGPTEPEGGRGERWSAPRTTTATTG